MISYPQRCHRITESHNHRIVGVGRDLCGSSSPTLLLKQGHLQQAAQDLVSRRVLNISREGDSTTSLGSLGQGSVTTLQGSKGLHWEVKFLLRPLTKIPLLCSTPSMKMVFGALFQETSVLRVLLTSLKICAGLLFSHLLEQDLKNDCFHIRKWAMSRSYIRKRKLLTVD